MKPNAWSLKRFLRDTVENPNATIAERLKAADLLLRFRSARKKSLPVVSSGSSGKLPVINQPAEVYRMDLSSPGFSEEPGEDSEDSANSKLSAGPQSANPKPAEEPKKESLLNQTGGTEAEGKSPKPGRGLIRLSPSDGDGKGLGRNGGGGPRMGNEVMAGDDNYVERIFGVGTIEEAALKHGWDVMEEMGWRMRKLRGRINDLRWCKAVVANWRKRGVGMFETVERRVARERYAEARGLVVNPILEVARAKRRGEIMEGAREWERLKGEYARMEGELRELRRVARENRRLVGDVAEAGRCIVEEELGRVGLGEMGEDGRKAMGGCT